MNIFRTFLAALQRFQPSPRPVAPAPSQPSPKPEESKMTLNPLTHLSANFTIEEFERSQTAIRHGIPNRMTASDLDNARRLAERVLQPIRDQFGVTVVTSGYRSPEVNQRIGGARNSQHMTGQAADIRVPGMSNYDLAVWIRANLDYDQLILEAYTPGEVNSGWVHVSYVGPEENRKENLTATFHSGSATYHIGLVK